MEMASPKFSIHRLVWGLLTTTETTDLPAEASAKEGTTERSGMWII